VIANPIIHKEVLSSLRTRKAVAMQAAFMLVMAALAYLYWPADGLQDIAGAQARRIFSILAVGELLMVAVFAPAFTAAALTSEREHNTLESLFATAMKPWEIIVGKMVGALAFLVLLTTTGVLGLAAPFLLGGIEASWLLACMAVLLVTAVFLGMVGLLISSFMRRSYRSIIVTYVALLVLVFLAGMPAWNMGGASILARGGSAWQAVTHVIASFSPLEAMVSLVMPDSDYARGAAWMPAFWKMYLVMASLTSIGLGGLLMYRLRRPIAPPRPRERLKVVEGVQANARGVFFLFFFDPARRKPHIRWWQNPVLVKEFRTRPMLQKQWIMRAVSIALIASVLVMLLIAATIIATVAESPSRIGDMAAAVAALMTITVVLVGPALSSGAICSDRESGVWDLMRTTRLANWRIVSGKFQASIIPMILLTVAMLPALLILLYFDASLWIRIVHVMEVVGVTILFVCTTGIFFSSMLDRTSTSTAWTYAVVIAVAVLTLLVLVGQEKFSPRFVSTIFTLNPVAAAMDAAGHSGMQKYGVMMPFIKTAAAATAAMFVVSVARVVQLRRAS
jgi:ABC-type transport system involved in multi-copper enzyme maturation permease subunit